ncbi:MAG: hypothetical protein LBE62_11870 [Azonexus sp.]|jgi:hypothetical protein|nr:hypothetical protein [Azonexus sp.]
MKPMKLLLSGLAALLILCPARADEAAGDEAIARLGRLNGVALACEQPAIASRVRHLMQTSAPKTRGNGEIFEQATSAAFLEQGQGRECPDIAAFNRQLGDAEQALRQVWPSPQ